MEKALGVDDLKKKLRTDWRGTVVTTVQAFQKMGDLAPLTRDNVISMVDECHRSQKGERKRKLRDDHARKTCERFSLRFHWDPNRQDDAKYASRFRPVQRRSAGALSQLLRDPSCDQDGATLEVHYIRDRVPFKVDEQPLSVGFEQMCEEMEREDDEAKDFVQRQRSQWKELARHPDRVDIVSWKRCSPTSLSIQIRTGSRRSWSR